MPVNAIYAQLANFFFVMAAIFNDILLIRISLVIANGLLLICAALGWPLWPEVIGKGVAIDTLIWCSIAFVLHLWATIILLRDERGLKPYENKNNESLYQFFKRRSGISRRDFNIILTKGRWTRVPMMGTSINTDNDLHLIVEGYVDCTIEEWRRRDEDGEKQRYKREPFRTRLSSGELFDMRLANVFDLPIGFFNSSFAARSACNDVLLFSWSVDALQQLNRGPPVVVQAWRNLIAFCVADVAHRPWLSDGGSFAGSFAPAKHADFLIPPEEEPKSNRASFLECMKWVIKSMDPRPPPGLRHTAIPELSLQTTSSLQKDARWTSNYMTIQS